MMVNNNLIMYVYHSFFVCLPEGNGKTTYGWWFQPTPLKNHGLRKCWDDEIPN